MRNDFETGYLMHWGIKKGGKKENHKYYERVEKNGKYLYFYTQAEYEAWLHKGNKALDSVKNKMKAAAKKPTFKNTRQKLLNALNVGRHGITNSIVKAQKTMTKSNAQSVIDRGNKAISSIINKTSSTVSKQTQNLQKSSKAASANIQQRAKNIANNVSKTLQKAGKDTSKAVQKYVSKGEKVIKSTLAKAGNTKMSKASKTVGSVGLAVISSLLATAAVAAISYGVKKVVNYVKDKKEKIRQKLLTDQQREAEGRKKEIEARNEAKEVEKLRQEQSEKQFSNDAIDSHYENTAQHSDIPSKEKSMSKDDDMQIVNMSNKLDPSVIEDMDRMADEYYELMNKYYDTGDEKYYDKADEVYDKIIDMIDPYEGYLSNCANCTLTYDLRRRGYDVNAPWNPEGTSVETIYDWYKIDTEKDVDYWQANNKDRFSKEEAKELVEYLNNQYPEGSYGHFMTTWSEGGGHDCVWSKENGKIIIRDCQTNQIVDPEDYILRSYDIEYFRADDKELSDTAYTLAKAEITNSYGEDLSNDEYAKEEMTEKQRKAKK